MRALLVVFISALVLFVVASIASHLLQPTSAPTVSVSKSTREPTPSPDAYGLPPKPVPPQSAEAKPLPTEPAKSTTDKLGGSPSDGETTAPAPPPSNELRRREADLAMREELLKLIQEDVRRDFVSLHDLQQKIGVQVKQTVDSTNLQRQWVSRQADSLSHREKSLLEKITELERTELPNLKRLSTMYDNMTPDNAAKILGKMSQIGEDDTAAKLLGGMKERQAAKVLAELSTTDEGLAARLTEKVRALRLQPPQPPQAPDMPSFEKTDTKKSASSKKWW